MSKKRYEETNISAIANAIRSKNGSSDTYKVSEMAGEILAIDTSPDLETLSVTQNGTYTPSQNKDGFSQVEVDVPQQASDLRILELSSVVGTKSIGNRSSFSFNIKNGKGKYACILLWYYNYYDAIANTSYDRVSNAGGCTRVYRSNMACTSGEFAYVDFYVYKKLLTSNDETIDISLTVTARSGAFCFLISDDFSVEEIEKVHADWVEKELSGSNIMVLVSPSTATFPGSYVPNFVHIYGTDVTQMGSNGTARLWGGYINAYNPTTGKFGGTGSATASTSSSYVLLILKLVHPQAS